MKRHRVSIAGLLGVVALTGLWLAALRSASVYCVLAIATTSFVAYLTTALGVIFLRGRPRAFCVGFLLFGVAVRLELQHDFFSWRLGDEFMNVLSEVGDKVLPAVPQVIPPLPGLDSNATGNSPSTPATPLEESDISAPSFGAETNQEPTFFMPTRSFPFKAVATAPATLDDSYQEAINERQDKIGNFSRIILRSANLFLAMLGGLIAIAMVTRTQRFHEPAQARAEEESPTT